MSAAVEWKGEDVSAVGESTFQILPEGVDIAGGGLAGRARIYGGVDQADEARLRDTLDEVFGDGPLDLVVDDCSHMYEPTRRSFNVLFPRVRPGGAYVIEDGPWAHAPLGSERPEGMWPGHMPLTRLVCELVLAIPSAPGIIESIAIDGSSATRRRGEAEIDPAGFDIAACSQPWGRSLLAQPETAEKPKRRLPRLRR